MIALSQFNSLSGDEAGELLAPCVAIPAWSDKLVNLRPFANREALLQVAREAMGDWGENDLNAALSAHPRIGEKPSGSQARDDVTPSSRRWTAIMKDWRRPCGRGMPATKPALAGCF